MVQFWTTPKGVQPERENEGRESEGKRTACALCENAAADAGSAAVGGLSDEYILQLQLQRVLKVAECKDAAAKRQSIKWSTKMATCRHFWAFLVAEE